MVIAVALDKKLSKDREETPQWLFPLPPGEAVKYLREHRGIIMSVQNLRQMRLRRLKRGKPMQDPARVFPRTSLWTKEELDNIPITWKTRLVEGFSNEDGR